MATYTWQYGAEGSGLHFTIVFDTVSNQFTVESHEGSFDLNALWWGDDVADGSSPALSKADNSLNMNGDNTVWDDDGNATSEKIDWDGYQKLSNPGLGTAGEDKASFIAEGESHSFGAGADFLAFLASLEEGEDFSLGVRATSVNGEGSIKFADTDPEFEDGVPPEETDHFPEWPKDISNVVLYFDAATLTGDGAGDTKPVNDKPDGSKNDTLPDGDGYYTVKIDNWPAAASDDLDDNLDQIVAYLIANDPNVDADTVLLGASIKGGSETPTPGQPVPTPTQFFALDNDLDPEPVPGGIFHNTGNGVDSTVNYATIEDHPDFDLV